MLSALVNKQDSKQEEMKNVEEKQKQKKDKIKIKNSSV